MLRAASLTAVLLGAAFAGCTGGSGLDALSFESTSLEAPSFHLEPAKGDKDTVFKVDAKGLGEQFNATWDWGDGSFSYGDDAEHKYGFTNGLMTVTLIVTDARGKQGIATRELTLGSGVNKAPTVTARAQKTWVEVGRTINLTASGNDGDRDPLKYMWTFRAPDATIDRLVPGETNRVPIGFDAPGRYDVKVRARDPKGGEAIANLTIDVSQTIPSARFEETFTGKLVAGAAGAGASEKAWVDPAPDTNVDAARHRYTLLYPGYTVVFLTWNDTSGQGIFDLDLELRAANGTTMFKSETRAPAAPFEFNLTQQEPGDYDVIVRGVVGADVNYTVLVQSTLQITPERVAAVEGRS